MEHTKLRGCTSVELSCRIVQLAENSELPWPDVAGDEKARFFTAGFVHRSKEKVSRGERAKC